AAPEPSGPPLAASPRARVPERFGKYVVTRHLADGGMAEVYLARASGIEGFEKNVVIKRLKPELAERPWATELFLQEARIAATLEHPQIAQVHDVGAEGGSYFFAMELVRGQDLRMMLRTARRAGRRFPLEVAIRIVAELCGALHYAHEKCGPEGVPLGLVHRDVSPSNVLVSYDGAVKLCDFGIAEVTARGDRSKRTRAGKLSYMSPEQCRGDQLDRRSDIFVLAIVLYELTTLSKLFKGASEREVMQQVVAGRVTPPSRVCPGYPAELERIVMKGLAVDPAARHATAQEMMLELEAFGREHRLAMSSHALARLMDELFPPHTRDGALPGVEVLSDLEYAEIVEIRPPRPWHRAALVAAALAAAVAAATVPLAASRQASGEAVVRQARAAAVRMADRVSSHVRAARARAAGIASTPMLRAAVATDARTVQDMVAHEGLLAPEAGEVIELLQWRGERAASLLRLPVGAEPTAPVEPGATRIDATADGLVVTTSAPVAPVYQDAAIEGALVLTSRFARAALAAELPAGLTRASLRGLDRELTLAGGSRPGPAGAQHRIDLPPARDRVLPPLALVVTTPPVAAGGLPLPLVRWSAGGLALAFLALYLFGRHRYRWWRTRS
ncbi:MAG TPA: serine/threonine-protein kinase, partial [Kofleriaceae bacterium]|nr:serine/threonine-protein kinase [Kofleriaceae bacterium]